MRALEEELCKTGSILCLRCVAAGYPLTYRVYKTEKNAYSIEVSCGENIATCQDIFIKEERAISFCELLAAHGVFPEHLQDIAEDFLCGNCE